MQAGFALEPGLVIVLIQQVIGRQNFARGGSVNFIGFKFLTDDVPVRTVDDGAVQRPDFDLNNPVVERSLLQRSV
jgi:hypothetical protein